MSEELLLFSSLYNDPNWRRGSARLADFSGSLEEYNYKENPDYEAIERDWIIVGKDISDAIKSHEQTCSS